MGGDSAVSKSVVARGDAGARGGHRGQHWGGILSDYSYSRTGSGRHDGGRVGGVLLAWQTINNSTYLVSFCTIINRPCEYSFVMFPLVHFPKSLIGEMESKEHEREEN